LYVFLCESLSKYQYMIKMIISTPGLFPIPMTPISAPLGREPALAVCAGDLICNNQ
jgi:hypothetical protein